MTYIANLKIMDGKDTIIHEDSANKGDNGTIVYTFKIPPNQDGGEYTIKINSYYFPSTSRKFRIRTYTPRDLFVTIDFSK